MSIVRLKDIEKKVALEGHEHENYVTVDGEEIQEVNSTKSFNKQVNIKSNLVTGYKTSTTPSGTFVGVGVGINMNGINIDYDDANICKLKFRHSVYSTTRYGEIYIDNDTSNTSNIIIKCSGTKLIFNNKQVATINDIPTDLGLTLDDVRGYINEYVKDNYVDTTSEQVVTGSKRFSGDFYTGTRQPDSFGSSSRGLKVSGDKLDLGGSNPSITLSSQFSTYPAQTASIALSSMYTNRIVVTASGGIYLNDQKVTVANDLDPYALTTDVEESIDSLESKLSDHTDIPHVAVSDFNVAVSRIEGHDGDISTIKENYCTNSKHNTLQAEVDGHTSDISALKSGKADTVHTHDYANTNHEHTEYITTSSADGKFATRSELTAVDNRFGSYLTTSAAASTYATVGHGHTGYASSNHSHSGYAYSSHSHPEYVESLSASLTYAQKSAVNNCLAEIDAIKTRLSKLEGGGISIG